MTFEVSVIIPVYNGSSLLEPNLTPFLAYLDQQPYKTQVILVDDGSSDAGISSAYAETHGLTFLALDTNTGKGAAIRKGFEHATGDVRLFTDADIPFQYQNFNTFISLLRQDPCRLIIGDRTDPLSVYFEKSSRLRNAGSQVVSFLVGLWFVPDIRDTQCGLKGMGNKAAERLFEHARINRFAIDIELIYLAHLFDIPVMKVAVQLRYNSRSSVNAVKDGLKLLSDLYRIRKIHGKRKYKSKNG